MKVVVLKNYAAGLRMLELINCNIFNVRESKREGISKCISGALRVASLQDKLRKNWFRLSGDALF